MPHLSFRMLFKLLRRQHWNEWVFRGLTSRLHELS